jgi:hypothetical protein
MVSQVRGHLAGARRQKDDEGFFDMLIADECHEMKGGETAQGIALGTLAAACGKTLLLTGTLLGGYARDAYYLMWRAFPEGMLAEDLEYRKPSLWIERYGVVDRIYRESGKSVELNRSSRGAKDARVTVREQPGARLGIGKRKLDGDVDPAGPGGQSRLQEIGSVGGQ